MRQPRRFELIGYLAVTTSDRSVIQLPGVVLAAGASSRMGRPKALLPLEPGGTVLGRILGTLADAHISPLVLVTRAYVDVSSPGKTFEPPR